jgi:hypothetical protein
MVPCAATMTPASTRPMNAMKRPTPPATAANSARGIALMISWRTPTTVSARKATPDKNTQPSAVCQGTPMPETHPYTASNAFHPMVVLQSNGRMVNGSERLEATALRYIELVACVGPEQKAPQEEPTDTPADARAFCRYEGGIEFYIYKVPRRVRIVSTYSGQTVLDTPVYGSDPECSEKVKSDRGSSPAYWQVKDEEILDWLVQYANPPQPEK